MKFKLRQEIFNLDDKPYPQDKEGAKNLELRDVLIMALTNDLPDEIIDGNERFERFLLAQRIKQAKEEVELTAEEITKLKNLVGKKWTTVIVGRVYQMLEKWEDKK